MKSSKTLEKKTSSMPSMAKKSFSQKLKKQKDARQVAFLVVCQILEWPFVPLETALQNALPEDIEQRDRAAAYRLVVCFLRQKGTLTALIEPFLKRSPPERVLWIIMLGATQILFLDTPPHAAIHTTVELARQNDFPKFTGLVNAILRRLSEKGQTLLSELDQARLNIPVWLWQEWSDAKFEPRQLAQVLNEEPPLDIHLKSNAIIPEGGEKLIDGHWRYVKGTKVENLEGYQEGHFWVQDFSSSLPALLLKVQEGEKIADLCAAPGGKTAQLIQAGGKVVAIEKKAKRLERLRENLKRLQMEAELVLGDAADLSYQEEFDAILLDAPCSATGIFRRHPDVLHLKAEKEIKTLIPIQRKLIQAALTYLKQGGRLIYSVCSLQRIEAEEQAAFIMSLPGVKPMPFQPDEIPFLPQALTPEGWVRTLPFMWAERGGMDGFFIARFVKESS